MEQLRAMAVFVAVAEHGSFARAAERLSMSRPAVTRAIKSLEDAVGVQLLVRTTRTVTLSQVGAGYVEDCKRILDAVVQARDSVRGRHGVVDGVLSVTAPVLFGRSHVLPLLEEFLAAHPKVDAHIALLDRVTRLEEEGFDVALRIGHLPDGSQRAVRVGQVRRLIIASPAYLKKWGTPGTPSDLDDHALVVQGARRRWRFANGERPVRSRLLVNDVQAGIDLAKRGFGLTQVLSYQVGGALADGRLVEVMPEESSASIPVHVVLASRQRLPARTRAFVDHVVPALRARSKESWSSRS